MAKKMKGFGNRTGLHTSMNDKFLPSQKRIDGQGEKGKLFNTKKDKSHAAAFDMPSHGVQFDTQGQRDFNAMKVDKKGNHELEK